MFSWFSLTFEYKSSVFILWEQSFAVLKSIQLLGYGSITYVECFWLLRWIFSLQDSDWMVLWKFKLEERSYSSVWATFDIIKWDPFWPRTHTCSDHGHKCEWLKSTSQSPLFTVLFLVISHNRLSSLSVSSFVIITWGWYSRWGLQHFGELLVFWVSSVHICY